MMVYLSERKFNLFIKELKSKKGILKWSKKFHKGTPFDIIYVLLRHFLKKEGHNKMVCVGSVEILLQTWNMAWYRSLKPRKKQRLTKEILYLLRKHYKNINVRRSISSLNQRDKKKISLLFNEFRKKLGPVGTSKALHLLNPKFFPIWDNSIADHYHKYLHKCNPQKHHPGKAMSCDCYFQFCLDSKEILKAIPRRMRNELVKRDMKNLRTRANFPRFEYTLPRILDKCNYAGITERLSKQKKSKK